MKVDDDVFVDLNNTVDHLERLPSKVKMMTGLLYSDTKPIRSKGDKWYVSEEEYKDYLYPDYMCGLAYIMSGDLPRLFYKESAALPYFQIEDVFIGILVKRLNVTLRHDDMFARYEKNEYLSNPVLTHPRIVAAHVLSSNYNFSLWKTCVTAAQRNITQIHN